MTQEQFDWLNDVRKRLEDYLPGATWSREELIHVLRERGMTEDAERACELPHFRTFPHEDGDGDEVRGTIGVVGWLWADGSCRLKG